MSTKTVMDGPAFEKKLRSFIIDAIETTEFAALAKGIDTAAARAELGALLALAHIAGLPYREGPGMWDLVQESLGRRERLCGEQLQAMPDKIRRELLAIDAPQMSQTAA